MATCYSEGAIKVTEAGKRRQIEKPKGSVLIQGCSAKSEVFWDLSNASYAAGPEPVAGFCILVLINSEIVLVLGDNDQELASKKCKVAAFSLVSRCSGEEKGGRNWTLSVSIDERNVIVVPRLQWNFRGNQTIFVDGLVVDMMWDVHDWMFGRKSSGAVFMFRTRSGLDSRLWLAEKNLEQKEQENLGFCFLICACKNPS
nr:uncharacterized protein LOC109181102 [Ipomoea batatas]